MLTTLVLEKYSRSGGSICFTSSASVLTEYSVAKCLAGGLVA